MFEISMLGNVNNLDLALEVSKPFLEAGPALPGETAGRPDVQSLIARFDENPDRNVLLWLLDVVFDISAPVYWWKQIQQYDVDIFWVRRQRDGQGSERLLSEEDFEGAISPEKLFILNNYIRDGQPEMTIKILPLNFIQRGFLKANYKTLNEIYCDRGETDDERWRTFVDCVRNLPYNALITRC